MAGIIEFITDLNGNQDMGGEFIGIITNPDCTQQNLADFFNRRNYEDVTADDIGKLMRQRNHIAEEWDQDHSDY